jgi:hypothetical protein
MIIFIFSFIILFVVLILLFLINSNLNKNIESFEDKVIEEEHLQTNHDLCPNFYKNAFCQFDINENKNMCKYQKDNVKIAFNAPNFCCNEGNGCSNNYSSKTFEFTPKSESSNPSYYCNIGGQCKKYNGTILNSHISTNNCGTDVLNNQLLLPYASYEECSKTLNPCDKYNNSEWSEAKIKTECLKNTNCGICTNDSGKAKCIEGTPSEPLDLNKYYYCSGDKYEYGNHAQYII